MFEGVDIHYTLTGLEPVSIQHLGAYFHLPVERLAGKVVRVFPGFTRLILPETFKGVRIVDTRGNDLVLCPQTNWEMTISVPQRTHIWVADERGCNLPTFRINIDFNPTSMDAI